MRYIVSFLFIAFAILSCKTGTNPSDQAVVGVTFVFNGLQKTFPVAYYKDWPADGINGRQVGFFSFLNSIDSATFYPGLSVGAFDEGTYWDAAVMYRWAEDPDSVATSEYIPGLLGLDTNVAVGGFVIGSMAGPVKLYYTKPDGAADTNRLYAQVEHIFWNVKRVQ